jgi:signal transduction histidine kinase
MPEATPTAARVLRQLPRARIVFLVWTVVGIIFGARSWVMWFVFGAPHAPNPIWMVENILDGWFWGAITFPVWLLALRIRFTRRRWPLALGVHLGAAISSSLLCIRFDQTVNGILEPGSPAYPLRAYFQDSFYTNLQWYAAIVAAAISFDWYRRYRDREVHAARMDEQLAAARLEALTMQIQPHFLFNTLHTISELVHEDPDAAERMIARLGDLLRLTVDNAQTHEVTLAQEMEFLEAYLEIQRTRFQDRLEVMVNVDPDARDALVPNLVLQPLVENAIRHGTASLGGQGRILVKAVRVDGRLRMEVHDNGRGPQPEARPRQRQGVGVRNTRSRLEQMYGGDGRLELTHCPIGGTVAAVEIPFRRASAALPVEVAA